MSSGDSKRPAPDPTGPTLIRGEEGTPRARDARIPRHLGPYELIEVLGQGGMGVVYRARHGTLGTECAVKVLVAGEHASAAAIARFQREAASVARMGKHPNIVSVFDLAQEGPVAWYAMELVRGRSLRDVLEGGTLDAREAARIVEKTARALHFAHGHGVVHRDVKPENILVREDGEPQVMDFGLARDLRSDTRLSAAGEVFGTPSYMAPEQARGLHDRCDARTDVYALGGVLYDALTGLPPHPGKDLAQVFRHALEGEVVPPRRLRTDLPLDLEIVCLKCLEADRAARYASAEALADDLARFLRGEPVSARPLGWLARQARRVRRRPLLSSLVGVLCAALLALSWRLVGPARLRVAVDPEGAQVEAIGRSLWNGWVWPAGRFTLRVTAPGREPREIPVDLSPGSTQDLDVVRLSLLPAELTLTTWPTDAAISLVPVGGGATRNLSAPIDRVPILAGSYRVKATREGWFEAERTIQAPPGGAPVIHLTLRKKLLWARDLDDYIDSPPTLADLDRDGALDVVVCTRTSCTVWALSGRDGSVLWRRRVGEPLMCTPFVADRNRDAVPDVRVVSHDRHAFALDGRDGALFDDAGTGPENGPAPPEAVDVDGDGFLDRLRTEAGRVILESVGGVGVASVSRNGPVPESMPVNADMDGDGVTDVAKLSGYAEVQATSGKTGAPLWTMLFMEGVSVDPFVADLDGDGLAECVVACDDGRVRVLWGNVGLARWTWRIDGMPKGPVFPVRTSDRKVLDTVVTRADGLVFVLAPPDPSRADDFQRMLDHRAAGRNWRALATAASNVSLLEEDAWRKSVAWSLLGVAHQRLGESEEALSCFAKARELGLRCPESAASEWLAAWSWKASAPARRDEVGKLFEEGLRVDPDRLFDAVLEGRSSIDAAAARDLAARVRDALEDPRPRAVAAILATLLLPDDTRPPEPANVEARLREAVHDVQERLAERPSLAPRLYGYLCLLHDALGDEKRYRTAFENYTDQPARPPALDALLLHIDARHGLR